MTRSIHANHTEELAMLMTNANDFPNDNANACNAKNFDYENVYIFINMVCSYLTSHIMKL